MSAIGELVRVDLIRMDGDTEEHPDVTPEEATTLAFKRGEDVAWKRLKEIRFTPKFGVMSDGHSKIHLGYCPKDSPVITRGIEEIPTLLRRGRIVRLLHR